MRRGIAAVALGAGLLSIASTVPADQVGMRRDAAAVRYDLSRDLGTNLQKHSGERVELILQSGKSLVGTVKDIGSEAVHLSALEGKEYYDAVVKVQDIGAFVVRAK